MLPGSTMGNHDNTVVHAGIILIFESITFHIHAVKSSITLASRMTSKLHGKIKGLTGILYYHA